MQTFADLFTSKFKGKCEMRIAMRIQWVLLQRGCVHSFNTLKLIIDTFEVEGNAERCLCGIDHLAATNVFSIALAEQFG